MGAGTGAAKLAAPVSDVELDLKEYTSADRTLEALTGGRVDIAVGPRPTRTEEHVEVLGREKVVVVGSAEHRFASMDAVPLVELAAEPLVHYNRNNGNAGVAIVPFSALTPWPGGTVRSVDPPELRDVVVVVAAPHDELLRRFVADLKRRGLPDSRITRGEAPATSGAGLLLPIRSNSPNAA